MAYINQEKKAKIVAALKPLLLEYGIKATFAVRSHSTFVVNIKAGEIDFINNYVNSCKDNLRYSEDTINYIKKNQALDINQYWFHEQFSGKALDFLTKLFTTIKSKGEWYDNSDIMTDYFDTAFYVDVNVGQWNKPYQVI